MIPKEAGARGEAQGLGLRVHNNGAEVWVPAPM